MMRAQQALQHGDRRTAYQMYNKATRIAPDSLEAWLGRADNAFSFDDQLFCLNQAINLAPDHPTLNQRLYEMIRQVLEREPALVYLDETGHLYRVSSRNYASLAVPKQRQADDPNLARAAAPVQRSYRWLVIAALGLSLAGVGALLLAPIAMISAIAAMRKPLDQTNRIRAQLSLVLAMLIWVLALPLVILLFLHTVS